MRQAQAQGLRMGGEQATLAQSKAALGAISTSSSEPMVPAMEESVSEVCVIMCPGPLLGVPSEGSGP